MSFYHLNRVVDLNTLPENTQLLVVYEDNWADEIDLEGWQIFTVTEWLKFAAAFDNDHPYEYGIGGNFGGIEYNEARDVLDRFTFFTLTDNEVQVLKRIFRNGEGYFPELPEEDYED